MHQLAKNHLILNSGWTCFILSMLLSACGSFKTLPPTEEIENPVFLDSIATSGQPVLEPELQLDTLQPMPAESQKGYAMHFETSDFLMPVLDKATLEKKLVFVDFYATWCLPCKLMEEEVFTDPEIGELMNKHFLNLRVNAESENGRNLAVIYEVKSYPTLLFMDSHGNVRVRKEGGTFQTELKELVRQTLALGTSEK